MNEEMTARAVVALECIADLLERIVNAFECREADSQREDGQMERIAVALEVLANAELEAKDAREVETRLADREFIRRQKERL